jgi:hypothetical protein
MNQKILLSEYLCQFDVLYTQNFKKIEVLRVPPIQIKPLSGTFVNYFGINEKNCILRILKFGILGKPFVFLMYFLLPICGKFARALLSHQIFLLFVIT